MAFVKIRVAVSTMLRKTGGSHIERETKMLSSYFFINFLLIKKRIDLYFELHA